MKVIVGHDGSASADTAVALCASLDWPPSSELMVVRVGAPNGAPPDDLETAAAPLLGRGAVRISTISGRPASELRRIASDREADLLIVGSRGRGLVPSMLLGSVAAELVERAPCSVLVARGSASQNLLFGTDASSASRAIPGVVCQWELFRGRKATVVGVVGDGIEERGAALETRRFAARLATCGIETRDEVAAGDPAATLIELVHTRGTDLLVVGPRGRSGLGRLLLGGVARNVVQHADCSVLVVRRRQTTRAAA